MTERGSSGSASDEAGKETALSEEGSADEGVSSDEEEGCSLDGAGSGRLIEVSGSEEEEGREGEAKEEASTPLPQEERRKKAMTGKEAFRMVFLLSFKV